MKRLLYLYLEDLLLLAGGGCVLYGLSMWSAIITWIVAGLMLIGLAVMIGLEKVKHAPH